MDLGETGYSDYSKPGSGDMLIAVVMPGTEEVLLDRLQVGETALEDWGMFGHDLQHTRRSTFVGPQTNNLKWSFTTENQVHSSPAIGADGTVYIGSYDGIFYAINPDGSQKWVYTLGGEVHSSPAIGADGTIYVGSTDAKLYAINPDSTEKWIFPIGGSRVYSSPAIGADGTIYVGCYLNENKLFAINPDWDYCCTSSVNSSPT